MDITKVPEEQRSVAIKKIIKGQLTDCLGVNEEKIKDDLSFFDMGMESTTSMEFTAQLQQSLDNKMQINPTMVFNYPTVLALADFIESTLFSKLETVVEKNEELKLPDVDLRLLSEAEQREKIEAMIRKLQEE